jgi:hypothetical protein
VILLAIALRPREALRGWRRGARAYRVDAILRRELASTGVPIEYTDELLREGRRRGKTFAAAIAAADNCCPSCGGDLRQGPHTHNDRWWKATSPPPPWVRPPAGLPPRHRPTEPVTVMPTRTAEPLTLDDMPQGL